MLKLEQSKSLVDFMRVSAMLENLDNYYPDFNYWLINQCIPGVLTGQDILLVAKEHEQVVGVALAKKTLEETKLRCVRVLPSHENKGVGIRLIDRTLHLLGDDSPRCTVSEEMLHLYSRAFINRYNFELTEVVKGMYRPGKLEYIFNGKKNHGSHRTVVP